MPDLTFPDDNQTTCVVGAIEQTTTPIAVEQFYAREAISEVYQNSVQFTTSQEFTAATLIGLEISIGLRARIANDADPRIKYFHGVVGRFSFLGQLDAPDKTSRVVNRYRAEIVPKEWFLSQTSGFRICQNKSIPTIVKEILTEHQCTDLTQDLGD
ncbi:MAG: hypothetical protein GY826_32750, partial [Fuerstiella sp.]|nr:hypothetical protein [Fuerstiella sp.]